MLHLAQSTSLSTSTQGGKSSIMRLTMLIKWMFLQITFFWIKITTTKAPWQGPKQNFQSKTSISMAFLVKSLTITKSNIQVLHSAHLSSIKLQGEKSANKISRTDDTVYKSNVSLNHFFLNPNNSNHNSLGRAKTILKWSLPVIMAFKNKLLTLTNF